MLEERFWEKKSLSEMNRHEWEALCDGCGKCCLIKLEDEDSAEVFYTNVVCRYFQQETCQCSVYRERKQLVPDCVVLELHDLDRLPWMPATCAYRLLHEGKTLPDWHPLVCGQREDIEATGNTISGKAISEEYIHEEQLEEHIISWIG